MTRFKLTPGDDGSYELTPVPDEPAPAGHTPLTRAAVAAVVIALAALYGCTGHSTNTPTTPTTTASATR